MAVSLEYFEVYLDKDFDIDNEGLIGIEALLYLYAPNPDDTGTLEIKWGNSKTETFGVAPWALLLGQNEIGFQLPPGTHTICARMV